MNNFINLWHKYVLEESHLLFEESAPDPQTIENIFKTIQNNGGTAYIVGGAVRDELMPNAPVPKDVDFVVTGLELEELNQILSSLGKVDEVGKSFGILKAVIDDHEFDFSLPRTEKKVGSKHTDFEVVVDPHAPVEDDMARRDFTMNALLKDSTGKIIDIFGGIEDINNKLIKAVGEPNERFNEDPLRILRSLQFAARFDFDIEDGTKRAIKNNIKRLQSIAPDRIYMEFIKAWTKGNKNGAHLSRLLVDLGVGEILFGYNFQPVEIQPLIDSDENVLANFVAYFIKGGNIEAMRPTAEMAAILDLAKQVYKEEDILSLILFLPKVLTRDKLNFFLRIFEGMGTEFRRVVERVEQVLTKPIARDELEINGREIMELGFSGKEIGETFNKIFYAIHNDELANTYDEIISYLGGM